MGECYNPYPKLPKNIRQIGERDPVVRLYMEDYVNTYLKRLYPAGGRDLRVGLLLGEIRTEEGVPYVFVDGAMEMPDVNANGERVEFTETAWKQAWKMIEQHFPKHTVLGWFLCGGQGSMLSPLNYWREHGQYFSAKYQLMYLNSSLDGDEAVYMASEDGFYHLRGYCIYYERNQLMQDYMITRKEAHRVESGVRDDVIRDFRLKMEDKKLTAHRRSVFSGLLGTACGVLSVAVLAGGVVMFDNYNKMKKMEAVLTSVFPSGTAADWQELLGYMDKGEKNGAEEVDIEEVSGNLYPILENSTEIVYVPETETMKETVSESSEESGTTAASEEAVGIRTPQSVRIPENAVAHIVQEGETLYGICLERYHSIAVMEQICQWNQLPDENHIMVGQRLWLPPVE